MTYYSMLVIWPRQSGLLFVPAEDTIMRGVYANIPPLGNFGVYARAIHRRPH